MPGAQDKTARAERGKLGLRIAEARERAGLNKSEAARALGVRAQSLHDWEIGRTAPSRSRLMAIANLYGLSLGELLGEPVQAGDLTLSARERQLLEKFREIHPEYQKHLENQIDILFFASSAHKVVTTRARIARKKSTS
jgi:transcriptional regulator with XRE-family HTH domain